MAYSHIHTISQLKMSLLKFCMFLPFCLTDYLIGLTFWVIPIGHKYMAWSGTKKGTNKTLTLMGLGFFYQLLTNPKLPLIIFNTTL